MYFDSLFFVIDLKYIRDANKIFNIYYDKFQG